MNKTIKCLAVDDEPLALEIIESHISKFPNLKLMGKCGNAIEAAEAIKNEKPDLIFLDINMPEITGIEFMKTIRKSGILVVFTTAYTEYAVDAFALDALDYLLKPISLERFGQTVSRAEEYFTLKNGSEQVNVELNEGHIFVKSDSRLVKIGYDEIYHIEAFADYVKIHIENEKRIVTLQTMRNMELTLPKDKFCRVHRSFIISLNKVKSLSNTEVQIGNKMIPIGKNYKDEFMASMQQHNILK
ncbi:MAG: response regulator transcription factor [Bacteroidia bacterium]|nr:response regulator transcription factor [Bacteroidia bacterium]